MARCSRCNMPVGPGVTVCYSCYSQIITTSGKIWQNHDFDVDTGICKRCGQLIDDCYVGKITECSEAVVASQETWRDRAIREPLL
jgi:hypothetical protein